MSRFELLFAGLDVAPILAELDAAPHVWGARRARLDAEGSPHIGVPDVWVRYRAERELTTPAAYAEPHASVWYPEAELLPSVRNLAHALVAAVRATQLGGVLITRVPAGGEVAPHDDRGSWHAEFYNCKLYVVLRSNPYCLNTCGADVVNMRAGEVWRFDNLVTHSVENNGTTDRETLIVCLRTEP